MGTSGHIIRDAGPFRPQANRSIAWIPGTVLPYSSLWIMVQRFVLLNRPSRAQLDADIPAPEDLSKTDRERHPLQCYWVRPMRSFARLLGEPVEAFSHSQVGQFPSSTVELFNSHLRWCGECLFSGFHTVLFSLNGLRCCPAHGHRLVECCFMCGRSVRQESIATRIRRPGCCSCGFDYLFPTEARQPQPNARRDAALGEIAQWLTSAGRRSWFALPGAISPRPEMFFRQLTSIQLTLDLDPPPASLDLRGRYRSRGDDWTRQVHQTPIDATTDPRRTSHTTASPYSSVFKSIRRYVIRHLLANRRQWLTRFAQRQDADDVLQALLKSRDAQLAWALLLWWQASMGSVRLRDWFQRRNPPVTSERDFFPTPLSLYGHPLSQSGTVWACCHIYAAQLIVLLNSANAAAQRAVRERSAVWGRGVTSARELPVWSLVPVQPTGLTLCIDSQLFPWPTSPRSNCQDRRNAARSIEQRRLETIGSASRCYCLWYHPHDTSWCAAPGPDPRTLRDFRKRKLIGKEAKFILVVTRAADGAPTFAARCLTLPIAASGESPRQAIGALKWAVRHYRRHIPAEPDGQELTRGTAGSKRLTTKVPNLAADAFGREYLS